MGTTEIVGIGFIAVLVIKELFVLIKGDSKEILRKVSSIEKIVSSIEKRFDSLEKRLDRLDKLSEQFSKMEDHVDHWYTNKQFIIDKVNNLLKMSEDLWEWHNKEDEDGVKIWYVRSSLQKTLERLSGVLETESVLLEKIVSKVSSLEEELTCLKEKLKQSKQ